MQDIQGRRCRLPFRQAAIAALSAWLLIASQAAEAECLPTTTPTTGQTVDCSGASSTPVEACPGQTDITVNILDGATLNFFRVARMFFAVHADAFLRLIVGILQGTGPPHS